MLVTKVWSDIDQNPFLFNAAEFCLGNVYFWLLDVRDVHRSCSIMSTVCNVHCIIIEPHKSSIDALILQCKDRLVYVGIFPWFARVWAFDPCLFFNSYSWQIGGYFRNGSRCAWQTCLRWRMFRVDWGTSWKPHILDTRLRGTPFVTPFE